MYIDKYIPETVDEYIFSQMNVQVKTVIIQLFVFLWYRHPVDVLKKIEHIFPIRGRFFNTCDRDFAVVKRKIRPNIYTR